jgi:hypothetical protein
MRRIILGVSLFALMACQAGTPPETTSQTQTQPAAQNTKAGITRTPTKTALFGDLHVHTRNSFDAYIFGTRADADAAYRFAQGEAIDNGMGATIALGGPPLDFFSVTDHGEYIGVVPAMADRGSALSKTETAKSIFGLLATDRRANFLKIGTTIVSGEELPDIYDRDYMDSVWADTVRATEAHNKPGVFTTFAGYEFTAMRRVTDFAALNLHRNVIFKDDAPTRLFTTLDSPEPSDLWVWMDGQRGAGRDVLAIPHNSNASNGRMFAANLSADEARLRIRNEPIVEITQVKGTSETHPNFSPNDEWADFELYGNLIGSTDSSTPDMGSFVRQALARGMATKNATGVNPYEFGVIGSSDTHLGAPALVEETFFGKFPHDLNPENRQSVPPKGAKTWPEDYEPPTDLISTPQYGASGLAGVWAEANTREDIFNSMQAKETFGTSGPRLKIRLFALPDRIGTEILSAPNMISLAYEAGVPMGRQWNGAPNFLAWAARDVNSAPLERLQMIKVWTSDTGPQEEVIDIACATGAPVGGRCGDQGTGIDTSTCTRSGDGAAELKTVWTDPDFAPNQDAAYYLRVLEAPKCRWSTWDAVRNGSPPNPAMKATVQDRAWSSAIWLVQ